jgi:hypothetical protein
MFSFEILKTLKENAAIFGLPLLAIAIFADVPFRGSAEASATMNMVAHAAFAIAAAVIGPVLLDNALFFLDRFLPEDAIFGFFGFLLLTFCLYGVSLFSHRLPPSPVNPAWHLAAGCYAFFLFERNALFASIRATAAKPAQRAVE